MRESGRLDDPSPVKPEMQDEGKPESYIAAAVEGRMKMEGTAGRVESRRKSEGDLEGR